MNLRKNCLVSVLFCLFLSLSSLHAKDSSSGCGVGWMVFKDNSLISSALRATTNAIFLNTVAMTFGTSGCANHSIVKNEKKSLHFMEANEHLLMVEMAQGGGAYMNGLSQLMGCESQAFSQVLQKNYQAVFDGKATKASDYLLRIKAQILLNKELAAGCGLI